MSIAWIPEPDADGLRRYRVWGGSPGGTREDTAQCIVPVADGGRSVLTHQCYRRRGHGPEGLYCAQHARQIAAQERKD